MKDQNSNPDPDFAPPQQQVTLISDNQLKMILDFFKFVIVAGICVFLVWKFPSGFTVLAEVVGMFAIFIFMAWLSSE